MARGAYIHISTNGVKTSVDLSVDTYKGEDTLAGDLALTMIALREHIINILVGVQVGTGKQIPAPDVKGLNETIDDILGQFDKDE